MHYPLQPRCQRQPIRRRGLEEDDDHHQACAPPSHPLALCPRRLSAHRFDATYKVDALAKVAGLANKVLAKANDLLTVFKGKLVMINHKLQDVDAALLRFLNRLPTSMDDFISNTSTFGKVSNFDNCRCRDDHRW